MRLHERTLLVQKADNELATKLWTIQDDLGLRDAEALILVATLQAEVAGLTLGYALAPSPSSEHAKVSATVSEFQQRSGVTDIELVCLLAAHQQRIAKFMLRGERHPDDPEAKADEE